MAATGVYVLSIDGIALSAGTAKTLVELGTPATDRVQIKEWWVEFDGITAANTPVKVEIGRFSSGVTTATTLAAEKLDSADGSAAAVAKHSTTVEGAGTISAGSKVHRIPPTSGYHYVAPMGSEFVIAVSTFWRIRCTAAQAVNATFGVIWEE